MEKRKEDRNNNGSVHPNRIFQTPLDLYNAFESYKQHVEEQSEKWLKVQYVGKDGERVTDRQRPPLTMDGFEVYCYKHYGTVCHYFDNKDGYYEEFGTICRAIKSEIRENQIIGGMLGFYNPSITQRLNSLEDKRSVTNAVEIKGISTDELNEGLENE